LAFGVGLLIGLALGLGVGVGPVFFGAGA
jgi:hypothetical protein